MTILIIKFFNIYLCGVGVAWLSWLAWDIQSFTRKMNAYENNQSEVIILCNLEPLIPY